MAFAQISTSVTILNSGQIGYIGISLTNFTTSAASLIASGSGVEIGGAWFKADTDITPNASSWTAISTSTTAYLGLTPSGTAGSQILSADWLSYAPTWQTAKQGWYASTASNIRVVASAYKVGTTSYSNKNILGPYYDASTNQPSNWEIVKQKDLGSGWATALSNIVVPFSGRQVFTSSGSFIVPAGVNTIYLTGTGGGGAGATASGLIGGNGGNAGEYEFRKAYSVTSETVTITIGAAGGNVTASSPNIVFSLLGNTPHNVVGTGGTGGNAVAGATGDRGGSGGGANFSGGGGGGAGALGIFAVKTYLCSAGGVGGSSGGAGGYGGGGGGGGNTGSTTGGAGAAGMAGGGGGGGGASNAGTPGSGGAGSTGIIIIEF